MQANSSSDSNDKVHIVLKRKPAKHNEEYAEPSTDANPEKEVKIQKSQVQEEAEPKPQTINAKQEETVAKPHSSNKPYLDGEEEPLDEFTYDANSF